MRRTLAAAVFTALSIATAGAQLTIPKEYLPKVHGTIRSKYELQTTSGKKRPCQFGRKGTAGYCI